MAQPTQATACVPCTEPAGTDELEAAMRTVLRLLGEDTLRPGLLKTPARAAKALRFLTAGNHVAPSTVTNEAMFPASPGGGMVLVKDIKVFSMCEHHMLPFFGVAHIAYMPGTRVLGLSKLARVTEVFSRRLQMQEQLTRQISEALMEVLGDCKGAAVALECQHMCMAMRGVQQPCSSTMTTSMLGVFGEDRELRKEFLQMVSTPRAAL